MNLINKRALRSFFIVFVPFLMILKQPDLGTALILIIIFISIVFFIGVDWKSLIIALAGVLILIPIGWHFLKDYQKDRLITFLIPKTIP